MQCTSTKKILGRGMKSIARNIEDFGNGRPGYEEPFIITH